ncbi:MAG TPA: hypothetical protein VJT84_14785 [Gaiellaceae bacterium]|nr:hypothetical protein [Gaiellaceae bacterium]
MRAFRDPQGRDAVYISLADTWAPNPDGYSVMLLPSTNDGIPTRIDLFFDADERLKAIRVEEPERHLKPELHSAAEAFPPPSEWADP